MLRLENGEIVTVDADGARIIDADGSPIERDVEEVTWDEEAAEKGGYETFMLKEIHEQPDAVAETITDRLPRHRLGRPLRARARGRVRRRDRGGS